MCEYSYETLSQLREEYLKVQDQRQAEEVGLKILAYLSVEDSRLFNNSFFQHYYGTVNSEPHSEPLPMRPQLNNNIAILDGILSRLKKPLSACSLSELRKQCLLLYKNNHIDTLRKGGQNNETIKMLAAVANNCDVRHDHSDEYSKQFNDVVDIDIQRTLLIKAIEILGDESFQAHNHVFIAVGARMLELIKASNLKPGQSDSVRRAGQLET